MNPCGGTHNSGLRIFFLLIRTNCLFLTESKIIVFQNSVLVVSHIFWILLGKHMWILWSINQFFDIIIGYVIDLSSPNKLKIDDQGILWLCLFSVLSGHQELDFPKMTDDLSAVRFNVLLHQIIFLIHSLKMVSTLETALIIQKPES